MCTSTRCLTVLLRQHAESKEPIRSPPSAAKVQERTNGLEGLRIVQQELAGVESDRRWRDAEELVHPVLVELVHALG